MDRPRRIWLENRAVGLPAYRRGGVQFARQRNPRFPARSRRRIRRNPLPRRHRPGPRGPVRGSRYLGPALVQVARTATRRRRRIFEAGERKQHRRPDPHLFPAQGQPVAGLESVGRSRPQPQAAPPRRPAQFLRFPRLGEFDRRPRERRQPRPRPAAKLGGRRRGQPEARRVGHHQPAPLRPVDRRHRRYHPDRRGRREPRQHRPRAPLRLRMEKHAQFRSASAGAAPSSIRPSSSSTAR